MADESTAKPTIETLIERVDAFQEWFESRFQRIDSKIGVLNDSILDLRVEVRSLIERIEAIEGSLKRK